MFHKSFINDNIYFCIFYPIILGTSFTNIMVMIISTFGVRGDSIVLMFGQQRLILCAA